jgi:hypothetical protein
VTDRLGDRGGCEADERPCQWARLKPLFGRASPRTFASENATFMNADSDHNKLAALVVKGLRVLGKRARALRSNPTSFYPACTDLDTQAWSAEKLLGVVAGSGAFVVIFDELSSHKPSMICRFGTVELAVMTSATTQLKFVNALKLLTGDSIIRDIGIHDGLLRGLCTNAGFFPADVEQGRKFVKLMLNDMKIIDVLGGWCKQEVHFSEALAKTQKVRFRDLEPYMHANPRTRIFAGRRVLVVHPFAETITDQYRRKQPQCSATPCCCPSSS